MVSTEVVVNRAADFHGHLGPFLVIGIRMGLAGLKELGESASKRHLLITASLPLRVPFSCIIDGIQVSTKCTVGNRKLRLRAAKEVRVEFRTDAKEPKVVISLNSYLLKSLRKRLRQMSISDRRVRQLASEVMGRPESELFTVRRLALGKDRRPVSKGLRTDDLTMAKQRLKGETLSLVFVKDSQVIFETDSEGLKGFLQAVDKLGESLSGTSVADKVVGRAAAFLCIHSGVKAVFAITMSRAGLEVLEAHGISCEHETLVLTILDRKKIGRCPFEGLVEDVTGPEDALRRIREQCHQVG